MFKRCSRVRDTYIDLVTITKYRYLRNLFSLTMNNNSRFFEVFGFAIFTIIYYVANQLYARLHRKQESWHAGKGKKNRMNTCSLNINDLIVCTFYSLSTFVLRIHFASILTYFFPRTGFEKEKEGKK